MTSKTFIQPLDRVAIALILVLTLLIGLLIVRGDVVRPSVRNFTWAEKKIGAQDIAFSMTFSRPMDTQSVEKNLKIDPPLAGKFSWAGRRMVYTLLTPAPYGEDYKVELVKARDKFSAQNGQNKFIEPFIGNFETRDRVIVYIGTDPQEQGRLILYNLTKQQSQVLTPKDLVVLDFEAFPNGTQILFSARSTQNQDILSAQIYTVTTGIADKMGAETLSPGKINLVLDNQEYQNLKFDLSPDGKTIVVQRGSKNDPNDFGLWFLAVEDTQNAQKAQPKRVKSEPGGDFIITPDSKAVAVAQGQGTAILPLTTEAVKPLDFLPQFGLLQAFSQDGSKAALVKFNPDYTKELFLVTNQGVQKQLLSTKGSILKCEFDPSSPTLYCLLTQLTLEEVYQEQPYLVAIDINTGQQRPLLMFNSEQRNLKMSLSPDGLGFLFDQVVPQINPQAKPTTRITTEDGQEISSSRLWLMPLLPLADTDTATTLQPEPLPLAGFNPQWLP